MRTPLYAMRAGGIWSREEVGEARKRVAAKAYIRRNSDMDPGDLNGMTTRTLVVIAQSVRDLTAVLADADGEEGQRGPERLPVPIDEEGVLGCTRHTRS